jgi:anti-sigma regulatory factor (Ser/Thr protein kinase)
VGSNHEPIELRASFFGVEEGLDILHRSVDRLRERLGRPADDQSFIQFETALAEIGGNALAHTDAGPEKPVELVLRSDDERLVAWVMDHGPQVAHAWVRDMPPPQSEAGRGLPLARSLLDELTYERDGKVNRWRLVKRL